MADNPPNLNIAVGDAIQLQFYPGKDSDERYYVRVIGFLPGKSILTTTPAANGRYITLKEGDQFAARLMSGNSITGFFTSVLKNAVVPYPYIHLGYPDGFESKVVRKAQRVNIKIISTVQNQEDGKTHIKTRSAVISDLSTAGALVITPEPVGDVGDMITVTMKVNVVDIEEYVTISAVIRRCLESDNGDAEYRYGIEFQLVEDHDRLVIHAFVYEHIAKSFENR